LANGLDSTAAPLLKAIHFAAKKHRNQRRKNVAKTPYINHPIEVAHILMFEGDVEDPAVLVAAVLHDTVEDTETTFAEIQQQFGKEVRDIVADVTDEAGLSFKERKAMQIEKAPNISDKAKLVKLADKISNLRDIISDPPENWGIARQESYFQWSEKVIDGLRGIHPDLEAVYDQVNASFYLNLANQQESSRQETR